MERIAEEAARLAALVDGISGGDMLALMNKTVGFKRAAELVGWSVLWGLQGESSGSNLRRKLEEKGMTYASAYRAINDFQKVSDALLAQPEYQGSGVFATLRKLAACLA